MTVAHRDKDTGKTIAPLSRGEAILTVRIWKDGSKLIPRVGDGLSEAFAPHLEHVANLCEQGYTCGQIEDEKFTGWWEVKRA